MQRGGAKVAGTLMFFYTYARRLLRQASPLQGPI